MNPHLPQLSPVGMVLHLCQPQATVGGKLAKQLTNVPLQQVKGQKSEKQARQRAYVRVSGVVCGLGVVLSCRISKPKRREEIDLAQGKSKWLRSENCR